MYRSVANKESLEKYIYFWSKVKLVCFSFFDIQLKVKLVCFSFFAFRFSLFVFRFSFFDIGIRAEYRILTFEILS